MSDKPILFSAPMVRALLDGRKTQTRRVLKPQPRVFEIDERGTPCQVGVMQIEGDAINSIWLGTEQAGVLTGQKVRFAVGDRLYVKEAWRTWKDLDHLPPIETLIHDAPIFYELDRDNCDRHGRYRNARFMMRHMSRLTLTVTDVRVQRLQDISEADVLAEGAPLDPNHFDCTQDGSNPYMCVVEGRPHTQTPHLWFHRLGDSINGPDAWAANPWVVALTFDVHRCNIDAMP